jgi:hypothetical protein
MDDNWKNETPRGIVEYKMTGRPESGFVYSAQLEGNDVIHQQADKHQLSRADVEKLFAKDFGRA